MLRKCAHNLTYEIDFKDIKVHYNMTYNEVLMRVLDYKVKRLRNKEIPLVQIQWKHHDQGVALQELQSEMYKKFLELF